jgi:trimeric autotransporter adhesin
LVSLATAPRAAAAAYTYTLTGVFSGSITTTCDSCALNASNITAWSISAGSTSVSSTTPGALLTVPAGDTDLQATPSGIKFSFAGPFGALTFSTPAASIVMTDDKNGNSGFGPGAGAIQGCTPAGACTSLAGGTGSETLSTQSIPFSGTVTYEFTGTVLSATGTYAGAASAGTVTGTYTFDLDAGDGALPVSFSVPWTSVSGSATRPRVFGSTLASGDVTFSGVSSFSYTSSVAGAPLSGAMLPSEYIADDREWSSDNALSWHSIQLVGGVGAKAPYDANGLPIIANSTTSMGTLTAYSNYGYMIGQLTYSIDTIEPEVTTVAFSPSTLNFPTLPVGTLSAPMTTLLVNSGDTPVTINGFGQGVVGPFSPVEYKCGTVLAAHASCSLSFDFEPTAAGIQEGTFVVDDNAVGSPTTLTMIGTGTPVPIVTLSAVEVSFPSQQVGTPPSVAQAVNVYNNLTRPLDISSVSIIGAQANNFVLKNACPASLPAGKSCAIFATFKPLIVGRLSAILSIVDDDAGSQQTVGLDGTSTAVPAPVAKLITTTLSFANEPVGASSTARAVNISNTGNAPLTFSSVSISGAQANEFELQDACVESLPAGRSCSLFVTFKPLTAGAATASLSIVENAIGSPLMVPLTGSATTTPQPTAKLSTTLLSFPNTPTGTASAEKAVVLTNTGTAALNLSSVSLGGYFPTNFSLRNACVQSLPAGHHCVLFVTFKPQSAGTLLASLSIVDNASDSTQSVTLTGTGT